jgi:hypothetical protein
MDQELLKLLGGSGVFGTAIYFGVKYGVTALERLYNDMKEQHKQQLLESKKREDKLKRFLITIIEFQTLRSSFPY